MVTRGNCSICSKVFNSDSVNVPENFWNLLKYLVETIDTSALHNVLICAACLQKINEAVNFKISHLEKQKIINTKTLQQKTDCDEKIFICYICKNTTELNSSVPLFNSCYDNVVSYMILKEDVDSLVEPLICDGCHTSALNFQSITLFLSVYDLNKTNNDLLNSETVTEENEFKIDIIDNCLPEDSKLNVSITKEPSQIIKEEIDESEEDFQMKQELDLKIECEAGPSSAGFWSLNNEDQERILSCPERLRAYTYLSNLGTSITKTKEEHKGFSNLKNKRTYKNLNDNLDEMTMFKCGDCEFQAKCTQDLDQHAIIHKNFNKVDIYPSENSEFQTNHKTDLKRHKLIHKDNQLKIFKCTNCEFQTKTSSALKTHGLIHKNINELEMFKCLDCKFQTKYKGDLKRHALIHNNIKAKFFKCLSCEYRTTRKDYLKRHAFIHNNINETELFRCPICQLQIKRKYDLKRHMLIHRNIGETELFKCLDCEFQTKHKRYLKQHERCHRNNETELLKCLYCEYQTKQKDDLQRHALIHNNIDESKFFKCFICQVQIKRKSDFKRHMLIHRNINEAELFKCVDCDFQTKHKHYLKKHMLIHKTISEVKMFKCLSCDYQTKWKSGLTRHSFIHKQY